MNILVNKPYVCVKCGQRFLREPNFLQHYCKKMKRDDIAKTAIGQSALLLYQKWMLLQNRGTPSKDAFLSSRYFNSFINFASFVKKTKMIDVDGFIELMKAKDISPVIWTRDEVYAMYLEVLERKLTPERQVELTINTLFGYAEDNNVDVGDVFKVLPPNDIIQLIREHRLSPWLLLHSLKFKQYLLDKMSIEQRTILESIIRPHYWKNKFANNRNTVEKMKKYVAELRL